MPTRRRRPTGQVAILAGLGLAVLGISAYMLLRSNKHVSPSPQPPTTRGGGQRPPGQLGHTPPGVTTAPAAHVVVSPMGPIRSFSPALLGFNGENIRADSGTWLLPSFLQTLSTLRPESLRIFGGTTANYWNWRTGTFFKTALSPGIVAGGPHPPITLSAFAAAVQAAGAIPIFDLNLVTSNLGDQLAMLHQAAALAMPVRYVELGNELYLNNDDDRAAFPTAENYGRVATQWIAAIKAAFPGVRVAVVGFAAMAGNTPERWRTWNEGVLRTVRGEDAMTFHTYWSAEVSGPAALAAQNGMTTVINATDKEFSSLESQDLPLLPAGVTAWITEWNLRPDQRGLTSTWGQGLSMATFAMRMINDPRIEIAENHALVGNTLFGAVSTSEQFRADGLALAPLLHAKRGTTGAEPLAFSMPPGSGPQAPSLVGTMFTGGPRATAVLVNLSSSPVTATLPPQLAEPATADQIAAAPQTVVESNSPSVSTAHGSIAGTLLLAPYSLTTIA